MAKRTVRVYNTTHLTHPPTGHMLDFDGKMFAPGRTPINLEIDGNALPETIAAWQAAGDVRVLDADSGEGVGIDATTQPILTAGTRVQEVADSEYKDEFEEEDFGFDPVQAREAALPGAHLPSTQQQSVPNRTRVSLGTEGGNEDVSHLSPIPGDRPRSVDNSDSFTIRAPRSTEPGGIIGRP